MKFHFPWVKHQTGSKDWLGIPAQEIFIADSKFIFIRLNYSYSWGIGFTFFDFNFGFDSAASFFYLDGRLLFITLGPLYGGIWIKIWKKGEFERHQKWGREGEERQAEEICRVEFLPSREGE